MIGIIFLVIFLCGTAVIVGLILGIVGLSTDKKTMRNAGFIAFGLGLILLVSTIVYSVNRAINKVGEAFEPFSHMADSLNNADYSGDVTEDVRAYLLNDTSSNATFRYIKEASYKKESFIPDSYFTYFGSGGSARFPLIYPFAIHCWDSKNFGTLVNEDQVVDIRYTPGNEENIIFNVQRFAFDELFILMQTSTSQETTDNASAVFMLYDMKTRTSKTFTSEQEMLKSAKKSGYTGEETLMSIWDYDRKF
ncbi:MAG: hypothetical protein K0S33_776 [Bacteroidetes bacterium]|jgi:hypothetical protein|nr:hypothetical protein [Bacteroidota bacterium]